MPIRIAGAPRVAVAGWSAHLRWDPAVFSFHSVSTVGALFDPAADTGACIGPNTTGYDSDGGGVLFSCAGQQGTTRRGTLAVISLAPAASGCSALHLVTHGGADAGDGTTGSYTIDPADFEPQANTYVDGTADATGRTCTPPAAPTAPWSRGGGASPLPGGGNCVADINRDLVVNTSDLAILQSTAGLPPSDARFKPWADLNGDGIVNTADLGLLKASFGETVSGCVPCRPFRLGDYPAARNVGWYRHIAAGNVVGGIYADLLNYSGYGPWVEPPRSFSDGSVYTVVQLQGFINPNNLVTFGWEAEAFGQHRTFLEYTTPGGGFVTLTFTGAASPATGTTNTYTVLYNNTPGDFTFELNGAGFYTAIPAAFPPDSSQIYSETKSFADQMPGGGFVPEVISNAHEWYQVGWLDYAGADENPDAANFKLTDISSTERHVEDLRCGF